MAVPFGANLAGLFRSEKGMGEAARVTRRALLAANVPLACIDVNDPGSANRENSVQGFDCVNPFALNLTYLNPEQWRDFVIERGPRYFHARRNIALWSWELSRLPTSWADQCRYFDAIWLPSEFACRAVAAASDVPAYCLPHAVETPNAANVGSEHFNLPRDRFLFLFAFDFLSHAARKNPVGAIRAFRKAFGNRTDVGLVLKTVHDEQAADESARLRELIAGAPNIYPIRGVLSRLEMTALTNCCDAVISLHRAEGFGLHLAEAMLLGKPVIATNYSANAEFMSAENSLPVAFEIVPIDFDSGPYRRGFEWADPDEEHAAALMRMLVSRPQIARSIGERARHDIASNYNPERIGQRMLQALHEIAKRCPRRGGMPMFWELLPKPTSRPYRIWWKLTQGRFGALPAAFGWPKLLRSALGNLVCTPTAREE